MGERRRTFGPVVLLGLAAGGLLAVAASKPWAVLGDDRDLMLAPTAGTGTGEMPLASALGLVVLACWGVLLVTRGTVRRAVAALGLLAAIGTVVTVVVAWSTLPDDLRDLAAQAGATDAEVDRTSWYWVAAVAALVTVATTALAVRLAPAWPEMGSRYDAPGALPEGGEAAPTENADLWKAMDEGRDPTV